jgi:hypothetical protein
MAQKPLSIVSKETEQAFVQVINNALTEGLPMFVIEPIIRLILKEAQAQAEQENSVAVSNYQAALAAEAQKETTNETTSA